MYKHFWKLITCWKKTLWQQWHTSYLSSLDTVIVLNRSIRIKLHCSMIHFADNRYFTVVTRGCSWHNFQMHDRCLIGIASKLEKNHQVGNLTTTTFGSSLNKYFASIMQLQLPVARHVFLQWVNTINGTFPHDIRSGESW